MTTRSKILIQQSKHALSRFVFASTRNPKPASSPPVLRCFASSTGGGNDGKKNKHTAGGEIDDEDPFGLKDTGKKLGSEFPPRYVRDKTTGKLTGGIEVELSADEKRILAMDPVDQERELIGRLVEKWTTDDGGDDGNLQKLGQRVGEEDLSLNVIGRQQRQQKQQPKTEADMDAEWEAEFSKPLSEEEFRSFSKFMKNQHDFHITKDDIPVASSFGYDGVNEKDGVSKSLSKDDNPDLDLAYLHGSRNLLDDDSFSGPNDPFSEIQPSDFSPTRLVNRKKAKPLPVELLHHNNLSILRRYTSPNGQIMNRVQSRLGAKDQRRVAKLIKRARALGLVPYGGQWKYESHGNMYEKDIHEDREWEEELKRRGLVIQRQQRPEKQE